jgi:hypothetical protein
MGDSIELRIESENILFDRYEAATSPKYLLMTR